MELFDIINSLNESLKIKLNNCIRAIGIQLLISSTRYIYAIKDRIQRLWEKTCFVFQPSAEVSCFSIEFEKEDGPASKSQYKNVTHTHSMYKIWQLTGMKCISKKKHKLTQHNIVLVILHLLIINWELKQTYVTFIYGCG